MSKRLYVGSLPYAVDDAKLREMFAKFGEVVDAKVITDRMSGQSKGFGFVEMSNDDEASKAMAPHTEGGLNGSSEGGRNLVVNEAREREERPAGGNPRYGGGNSGGQTSHYSSPRPQHDAAPEAPSAPADEA